MIPEQIHIDALVHHQMMRESTPLAGTTQVRALA
jgi:hypothetical protein